MEVLNRILEDWRDLRPDGMVAPASRLADVDSRVNAHLHATTTHGSAVSQDAFVLVHAWGGSSPLERMLVRQGEGSIQFLRFWRGMQELWRRLRPPETQDEPIAEEIATFRDGLIRVLDSPVGEKSGLSFSQLRERVVAARAMSDDEVAWASLEESISQCYKQKPPWQRQWRAAASLGDPACFREMVGGGVGALLCAARSSHIVAGSFSDERGAKFTSGVREEAPTGGGDAKLEIAEVSTLLFAWLQELAEDYCHGSRSALIRAVRDVAGCSLREACIHLSRQRWDVEFALLSFYGQGIKCCDNNSGWSSQGARLRLSEVDCPICAESYSAHRKSMATPCCFQTLCGSCHQRVVHGQTFHCPFCRCDVEGTKKDRLAGLPWSRCAFRSLSSLRDSFSTLEASA
eukprot:TRINITY_DN22682_c0_g1_i1.p1 TRINITY_DN22682_c0_g1~~TRINITY_DN22682_c0_g1_i1.p1  ORF type:complete len:457 (-),score=69.45 TRINITY_DN22682_c0_g1_i1:210-1418(-)